MKKLLALFLLLASVLCFAACPGGQNPGTTPGGDDETEVDYLDNVGSHDFGGGSELPPYSAQYWKMER